MSTEEKPSREQLAQRTKGSVAPAKKRSSSGTAVHYYLIAYNVLSFIGWSYILGHAVYHEASGYWAPATVRLKSQITSLLRAISPSAPSLMTSATLNYLFPSWLHPLTIQASTMYAAVGLEVKIIQSFAILEVLHAALGWVKAPIGTTVMQVGSRLTLVWGVADHFDQAKENPFYGSMILAWSLTEVIRYAFYACNLLKLEVPWLTYLRYTTFYLLYPMGAGSEAFTMLSTLPPIVTTGKSPRPTPELWTAQPSSFLRLLLFFLWWPGLWIMYSHMRRQRKKVLTNFSGRGKTLKKD